MNLMSIAIISMILMLVLMFLRMPLFFAMTLPGFVGIIYIMGPEQGFHMLAKTTFGVLSNYNLTVLPLFTLMGILAADTGLSKDGFYTARKWMGHFRGGLAMAAVGGCAAFAAVCGSSIATAATMCKVAYPEMKRYNYSDQLSLGAIACGGTLGFMIPPSSPFIVYGILINESIGSLFMAGILPGLLITVLFMIAIHINCRIDPSLGAPGPKASWKERIASLYLVWGVIVLFVLVMGGMYAGIFTSTEGGAVGAFGALVLGLIYRRISWKGFISAISEAAELSAMIFVLIIGSMIFNYFMAITEVPFALVKIISGLSLPAVMIVITILVLYVILGFFMEIIAVMVLTVPIFYPLLSALGIDPIWFGVLVVLTVMIGMITPPVGITVFAISGMVKDVPLYTIFRGIWPFFYAMVASMVILIAFPQISLWLPSLMKPG